MTLDFECGVQLKMGFAAEFSNVLVIYTNIVKKPEEMSSCQAHLINLSVSLPKDNCFWGYISRYNIYEEIQSFMSLENCEALVSVPSGSRP